MLKLVPSFVSSGGGGLAATARSLPLYLRPSLSLATTTARPLLQTTMLRPTFQSGPTISSRWYSATRPEGPRRVRVVGGEPIGGISQGATIALALVGVLGLTAVAVQMNKPRKGSLAGVTPAKVSPVTDGLSSKAPEPEERIILSTNHEPVSIRSSSGEWVPVNALLDTGNRGMTMISESVAEQLGLRADPKLGKLTVKGVHGQTKSLPQLTFTLWIQDFQMEVVGVVGGGVDPYDVIVGVDVLKELYDRGFAVADV